MAQYVYYRGSQGSRETVTYDIIRGRQYITTCVVAAQHLGQEHFKSRAEDNLSAGAYRQGYAEGREFDPTRRIAGGGNVCERPLNRSPRRKGPLQRQTSG